MMYCLSNHQNTTNKTKRQNTLREGENGEPNDIQKIVETYKQLIIYNISYI
jgi:hypothetical protein